MRTRIPHFRVLAAAVMLLAAMNAAQAQTVRGRVVLRSGAPASGIAVNVVSDAAWQSPTSYTGPDGMYYLYGIRPGRYKLRVYPWPNRPPLMLPIQVFPRNVTDIQPYKLP